MAVKMFGRLWGVPVAESEKDAQAQEQHEWLVQIERRLSWIEKELGIKPPASSESVDEVTPPAEEVEQDELELADKKPVRQVLQQNGHNKILLSQVPRGQWIPFSQIDFLVKARIGKGRQVFPKPIKLLCHDDKELEGDWSSLGHAICKHYGWQDNPNVGYGRVKLPRRIAQICKRKGISEDQICLMF